MASHSFPTFTSLFSLTKSQFLNWNNLQFKTIAAVWDEKMSPRHRQVAFYSFGLQHCISEHNFLGSSTTPSQWKTPALGAVLRSADCWGASSPSSCPHLRGQSVYHTSFPHSSCRTAFSPLSHSLSLWLQGSAVSCGGRLELSGTGCA